MEDIDLSQEQAVPPVQEGVAASSNGLSSSHDDFVPLVTVVGFHHARGPELETWFGVPEGDDPALDNGWVNLSFMALSDGAHASQEDFSYFTLLRPSTPSKPSQKATSLFGISCTRQIDSTQLVNRPADVTRSTVQKAVVVIADSPQHFGMLRERLSVITAAWFAQKEFTDVEILKRFQESLAEEKQRERIALENGEGVGMGEEYLGMSLRELVREFRWQTLVLFKCCLLQPKMLFFGSRCERLCMMQFSLISLIPGLIRSLQDCADPELDNYQKQLKKPTNVKSSDRNSLLSYMGLPLQIFGKGSLFGPYTPLQQLDVLADFGTKSYIVGSTNSLLLQQKDRYSDILINLDELAINITSSSLRSALSLSVADRRWIDFITQSVNDTWDEANPGRPKTMGFVGSEEFIRLQFEEYLLSLLSSVKCHNYIKQNTNNPSVMLPQVDGDPAYDFGIDWIDYWARSENYRIWDAHTDSHLFDIVPPKHPCAGGLTIDDVQRRMMEQVKEYHLDERFAVGKEALGRNLQAGKEKASTVFNKLYADMEALREAQRRRNDEARRDAEKNGLPSPGIRRSDTNGSKATVQSVSSKAGAYLGSWGTWAAEKKKGWGRSSSSQQATKHEIIVEKEKRPIRPRTQDSFEEAIFDAELAAKHSVDGVITKIEIPMSPPPEEEGKRGPIKVDKDIDTPSSPSNNGDASHDIKIDPQPSSESKRSKDLDRGIHNLALETSEPNVWASSTVEDEAIVAKRKGDISDAAATPISP